MNLDELRSVQAKERRKDSLQHLRDAFYDDVAGYVSDLRAARDGRADQVDDPFSDDDVRRMSDELETAEEVAEALYERRVGKVVKLASFAAADMSVETEGMTTQERALFDDLVARIRANKSEVLATLAGEVPPAGDGETPPNPTDQSEPTDRSTASDADGSPTEEADSIPESEIPPASDVPPDSDSPEADDPVSRAAETSDDALPQDLEEDTSPEAAPDPDVLAGAMGGGSTEPSDDGSSSDRIEPTDANASTSDAEPGTASTDGGPTPVDPDPAPPGAPGVDGSGVDEPGPVSNGPAPSEDNRSAATEERESSSTTETDTPTIDRETVRITRDVGEIFGVDEREYDLASEDVVTLPAANADPLVQRDAAERID
ncbi:MULTISPECIES: hypothetical protein [Haloferacaceae]|uniref:Gins51 C-terminal domain-containing protein n=1 Tax=Halorubrum glutamatedens TaxID=2707018 RepID=A0ABD5QPL0_9EURY|nr:hypothetical protein [Halobellus captivus]